MLVIGEIMRTRAGSVLNVTNLSKIFFFFFFFYFFAKKKPELSKRMSVMGDPSSDKPFPFALLPKQATVTLAK